VNKCFQGSRSKVVPCPWFRVCPLFVPLLEPHSPRPARGRLRQPSASCGPAARPQRPRGAALSAEYTGGRSLDTGPLSLPPSRSDRPQRPPHNDAPGGGGRPSVLHSACQIYMRLVAVNLTGVELECSTAGGLSRKADTLIIYLMFARLGPRRRSIDLYLQRYGRLRLGFKE
jgi:hypothetical protein